MRSALKQTEGGRIVYCVCVCVFDAACFCSVNVSMHVFRQNRVVLRIVTPHAPPSLLLSCTLPFFLALASHMLLYSLRATPAETAAINIHISQQLFKGVQGHPFCASPLCP